MKILPAFEIIIEYHISWTDQCDFTFKLSLIVARYI